MNKFKILSVNTGCGGWKQVKGTSKKASEEGRSRQAGKERAWLWVFMLIIYIRRWQKSGKSFFMRYHFCREVKEMHMSLADVYKEKVLGKGKSMSNDTNIGAHLVWLVQKMASDHCGWRFIMNVCACE